MCASPSIISNCPSNTGGVNLQRSLWRSAPHSAKYSTAFDALVYAYLRVLLVHVRPAFLRSLQASIIFSMSASICLSVIFIKNTLFPQIYVNKLKILSNKAKISSKQARLLVIYAVLKVPERPVIFIGFTEYAPCGFV